jgi:hypothetical protein
MCMAVPEALGRCAHIVDGTLIGKVFFLILVGLGSVVLGPEYAVREVH